MSASYFEVKDIKTAKAKCKSEPWFKLDAAKTRKTKGRDHTTYYIPFTAKNVAGKYITLSLRFARQVIASNAKIPYGNDENSAKDVRVNFRQLTLDDFDSTDYEESKREGLIQSNTEFIEALGLISDEYEELVKREVLKYKGGKFKLSSNKTINNFRQSSRLAADDETEEADAEGKVALPHPIFRVKITADKETKKLGYNSEKTGHGYVVFDMKKASKEAQTVDGKKKNKPVVAKIKTSKGYVDLTLSNAKHFITYMSLTGGMITFDSVCISKSGISLMCKFRELHVWRHRPLQVKAIDDDTVNDMAEYGTTNDKEDEEVYDEPEESQEKKGKSKSSAKGSTKGKKAISKALENDGDDEVPVDDEDDNDGEDATGGDEPDENGGDEDAEPEPKPETETKGSKSSAKGKEKEKPSVTAKQPAKAKADTNVNSVVSDDDTEEATKAKPQAKDKAKSVANAEIPVVTEEPAVSTKKSKTPPKLATKSDAVSDSAEEAEEVEEDAAGEDVEEDAEEDAAEEDAEEEDVEEDDKPTTKLLAKSKPVAKSASKPTTGGNLKAGAHKKAT